MNYSRLPRSAFRPLKITASLQCGVIGDFTLPFDGLLFFIIHREQYGRQDLTIPGEQNPQASHVGETALPLARLNEHVPQWYYAASFAQWGNHYAEGIDHWSSRLPLGRLKLLDKTKSSVDVASGRYKSYRMPVFYRHSLEVHWYALGEPGRIRRLLPFLTHLGKKSSQGWGAVNEWRVEEIEEDYSVRGPSGELMRAIPDPSGKGPCLGIRPSYWVSKNQMPCLAPGAEKS